LKHHSILKAGHIRITPITDTITRITIKTMITTVFIMVVAITTTDNSSVL